MTLSDVLRTIFVRRIATFLGVLIVSIAAAAVVVAMLPNRYEASAVLFVGEDRPIDASGTAQRDDVLARSYVELLAAPAVAESVAERIGSGLGRRDVLGRVDFEMKAGTQLIVVTASDGRARRAADLANVYASTFVDGREVIDEQMRRERLGALASDIRAASLQARRLRGSDDAVARSELADVENGLSSLRDAYKSLESSMVLEGANVSLATQAVAPDDAASPRPVLYMATAFLLALVLAFAAALLRERFDRRLRDEAEVAAITGLPILARVPPFRDRPDATTADAFAFLRANLVARTAPRSILLTSPNSGDGKTTTVLNLARSFAEAGSSVIAADFDFRARRLSGPYEAIVAASLADVAVGHASVDACLASVEPGVEIAVAGAGETDRRNWFNHRNAQHLTSELLQHADVVVIDTGPVNAAVETSIVASLDLDAIVIVVDLKNTTRPALLATVRQLKQIGANIQGIVLNRVKDAGEEYGYGLDAPAKGEPVGSGRPALRR